MSTGDSGTGNDQVKLTDERHEADNTKSDSLHDYVGEMLIKRDEEGEDCSCFELLRKCSAFIRTEQAEVMQKVEQHAVRWTSDEDPEFGYLQASGRVSGQTNRHCRTLPE